MGLSLGAYKMKSDTEPDSCGCLGSKGAKKSRGTALKWQGGR
jgi:hypothetical protein